jgi:BirA family transcriptional regulator, biotin operon repressor / biotin---[acetyl-CoA-carboxylase] ligase
VVAVSPNTKWPNDLVVGRRKLAGILAEASWPPGADIASGWTAPGEGTRVPVVVGMGLNVGSSGRARDLDDVAIACDELGGAAATREDLVAAWLVELDRWYARAVDPAGRDGLWAEWRRRSATLGQRVRVDLGAEDLEGEAVDVTPGGQLVVRTLEGTLRTLAVGDVTHLRPLD